MTFQDHLLEGKTALVTGGFSGIGAAIANQFARLGAKTVAAGLPLPDGASDTLGPAIQRVTLDVRSGDDVAAALRSFERLDIVVNCAGVISRVEEHRIEVFERVRGINLKGTKRHVDGACGVVARRQDLRDATVTVDSIGEGPAGVDPESHARMSIRPSHRT